MKQILIYILCAVISYLIGSVSISILLSKYVYGRDVRSGGSGNAGATNVTRTFGFVAGILTFVGDFGKCFLSLWLSGLAGGYTAMAIGAFSCMLGHCFPIYFRFKGGKGISCGAAIALMIDWRVLVIALAVFAIVVLLTKTVSIASLAATISVGIGAVIFAQNTAVMVFTLAACALAIFMHRSNIVRVIKGTEPKFRAGSAKH